MCYYHAYSHKCGHTECILQKFCPKGQMIQQKCGRGNEGVIMATVKVDSSCQNCPGYQVREIVITKIPELTLSNSAITICHMYKRTDHEATGVVTLRVL